MRPSRRASPTGTAGPSRRATEVHVVSGALKEYAWGPIDGLARWQGSTGAPQAELWFGIHPSGPSIIADGPDAGRLLCDLDEHRGMPLVKLLCAGSPLSIQVHPDEDRARAGWHAGSPLFADDAEKSEVLLALEPFEVHAGWRDSDQAADLLARAGAPDAIVAATRAGRPVEAAGLLLSLDPREHAAIESALVDAARGCGWPAAAVESLHRVVSMYPGDPGTLVTVLLGHARLAPGDAIAVPAGVVHSYVGGLAVEVMTSSDNVLRLGLTAKPLAVDEALAAVRADRQPLHLKTASGDSIAPAGMPFDLVLTDSPCELTSGRHRVVLALNGEVDVTAAAGDSPVRIPEGRAGVWAPREADVTIAPSGQAVIVTGADMGRRT